MSFRINPGPDSPPQNRTYLPAAFTTTTNATWVDPGLSIAVPQGTYKVRYNVSGTLVTNDSDGVLQMYARLFNVTTGTAIPESIRYVSTACFARSGSLSLPNFNAPYSGSIQFDILVYSDAPATYRVEIIKEAIAGSPSTGLNMVLQGNSYIEYEEA